jgi:hypothetical protein
MTQPADVAGHLREEVRLALFGLSTEDSRRAIEAMVTGQPAEFEGN